MLLLQCDASAAVSSQHTFHAVAKKKDRGGKKNKKTKNYTPNGLCLTFVMTGI